MTGTSTVRYDWRSANTETLTVDVRVEPWVVGDRDVLEYDLFPALELGRVAAPDDLDAATAVVIDGVLADGRTLGELGLRDHHGHELSAVPVSTARTRQPDQWNRISVDLSAVAGSTIVKWRLRVEAVAGGHGFGWVDGVRLRTRTDPAERNRVDEVITLRGSHSTRELSRGNTAPFVGVPNGFHLLSPVTNARDASWMYTYHRDVGDDARPSLAAFAVSHAASPWLGDRGVLHLFPVADLSPASADPDQRRRRFERNSEVAAPARYSVVFDGGARVTMAATSHAAVFDIDGHTPRAVLLSFPTDDATWDTPLIGTHVIRGRTRQSGLLPDGATTCYYIIELSQAITAWSPVDIDGARQIAVTVDGDAEESIEVRVGASLIDESHAEHHLHVEIGPDSRGESVAAAARDAWEERLSRFTILGGTEDQRTSFWSSLYRLFLYPSVGDELDPASSNTHHRVPGRDDAEEASVAPGRLTVNNGFWDTYRTSWPAYALFEPDRAAELLDGVVQHARDTGWIPRWTAPGPVDLMVGTSADIVIAEAICKNVPLPDPHDAFDACLRDAVSPSDNPAVGRKGIRSGRFQGFIASDVHEGLSWTLENATADDALSRAARALLDSPLPPARRDELTALADYLGHRATSFLTVFDPSTGFFRGQSAQRRRDEHFDPSIWGGDYTETNAWGMAFSVPHAPSALASLLGGRRALGERLDLFFRTAETADPARSGSYGALIHEMLEARNVRMGMFGLSNQPAHHIPFMYAYSDRPHRGYEIVADALRRCFLGSEIGQGYPGDEDNGEMSAWYILAAIGLYPLSPASAEYVLSPPLFPSIEIQLPRGLLRVTARRSSASANYIASVRVNGAYWTSPVIDHQTVSAGAEIEFTLSDTATTWSSALQPSPVSPQRWIDLTSDAVLSSSLPGATLLTDDAAESPVRLTSGDTLVWSHAAPVVAEQYTITCAQRPVEALTSWRLEGSDDGEHWQVLDARDEVTFRWPEELRPFPLRHASCRHHRLTAMSDGTATQIEILGIPPTTDRSTHA